MKLLEICQQLPDVDISEFQRFTSKWISYVRSSTKSNNISEMEWNLFFSQTNPVAGIDRGAMQDQNKEKNGYRERNERRSFVSNWDETILPILKDIINPDSENRIEKIKNVRNTVRNIIVQGGGRNTKAAINRMLITFCPDILIRIPNEDNTKEFIDLLKPFFDSEEPLVKEEDWIDNSFHIMESLKKQLGETIQKRTLWDLYTHLKNSDYKSNMNKEKGNTDMLDKYVSLLENNKNLILTGAPGTGKTYVAKAIAEEMGAEVGFVQFHPSYDYTDFVEGLRPIGTQGDVGFERKDGVFKRFCIQALKNLADSSKTIEVLQNERSAQEALSVFISEAVETGEKFRTSSTKNEFVIVGDSSDYIQIEIPNNEKVKTIQIFKNEIIRLLDSKEVFRCLSDIRRFNNRNYGTQVDSYVFVIYSKLKTRIARKVVVDAVQKKPFVFIIDEINRGEISKIFGELFFSIDPGYRGEKGRICTQYQNMIEEGDVFKEGFYVPENVYIIGTMNDIDRSVESMDFAMRRRFTWKEVTPADTAYMLDDLDCGTEAKATMNRLNKVIEETEGLGAAYMIGPAYFLKLGENGGDFNKLWRMNIEPLLKEYLRGFRKAKEILDKFSKAYFNKIDED